MGKNDGKIWRRCGMKKLLVYTDGSCTNNQNLYLNLVPKTGGWASVMVDQEKDKVINYNFLHPVELVNNRPTKYWVDPHYKMELVDIDITNNKMELLAAIAAFKMLLSFPRLLNYDTVEIFSDSTYVTKAFNEGWLEKWQKNGWVKSDKKPVLNKEYWEFLVFYVEELKSYYKAKTGNPIHLFFSWVRGHNGNKYNELADKLATGEVTNITLSLNPGGINGMVESLENIDKPLKSVL